MHRASADRHGARQALQEDEPPRVEIRAGRRRLAAELLGRRVARRSHELARRGEARQRPVAGVTRQAAQAEVEHERVPPRAGLRHHDVLGLQVAVDDAARVRAGERVEHLRHQVHGLAPAEAALAGEDLLQRRARHVLEDREEPAVLGFARVEQTDDVRVREPGAEPHLAPEALALVRDVGRPVVAPEAQDLDRDRLPRGALPCLVDAPEGPRAELGENLVSVLEDRPRREDARLP